MRFKDASLVVVEKKAGLLTHSGPDQDEPSLLSKLREFLGDRSGGRRHLKAVHRLDRVVSGLLVFSRTEPAFQHLKQQFAARDVERYYLAGVHGLPEPSSSRVVHHLDTEPMEVRTVCEDHPSARQAITRYQLKEHLSHGQASLLDVKLETGLRNQIRVQLAAIGHPLLGERKYHPKHPKAQGRERVYLHARVLAFAHPITKKTLSFEANPPPDLARWTAHLKRRPTPRCPSPQAPRKRR